VTRVAIKYTQPYTAILWATGTPPGAAYIEVDGATVRARMGWAFRAQFARTAVASVEQFRHVVSVGVHGWNGRWIVNGTNGPIARVVLDTPARARVMGVPVRLRELLVSVDDVAELKRLLLG
jgi:hypothetical protein